jgi:hypothetical protein
MRISECKVVIASDVSIRDGVGIEVYFNNALTLEIFRDDSLKARKITTYTSEISLEFMEECIEKFKSEIAWEFSS